MRAAAATDGELAASILLAQGPSGLISRAGGGRGDPWNHVLAAMALDEVGERRAARAAYGWLSSAQRPDGSWFADYDAGGTPAQCRVDTNAVAKVAAGVAHHLGDGRDDEALGELFPVVEAAVDFVVAHCDDGGVIPWNIDEAGVPACFGLLAASCSIAESLACASRLARLAGASRPDWAEAACAVRAAVVRGDPAFFAKDEYAMEWYYPVLCRVLDGGEATRRLAGRWGEFVVRGAGVRCRADHRWVTTAETAELATACAIVGWRARARRLLGWLAAARGPEGGYLTGLVYPERTSFPEKEESSYSAAAVVLARRALAEGSRRRSRTRREPTAAASGSRYAPVARASR